MKDKIIIYGSYALVLLTFVLYALKRTGVISWSWWLVTAPLWGVVVLLAPLGGLVIFLWLSGRK